MWNAMCYAHLLQMYVLLGQSCVSRRADAGAEGRRMDPEIVDSARLYIDQNFARSITLEDVSDFTGFSKYYFSRVFKQQMGVSFSEYLRGKRISMAEELLIRSRQSASCAMPSTVSSSRRSRGMGPQQ
jgi:two-component system response regulator YesN